MPAALDTASSVSISTPFSQASNSHLVNNLLSRGERTSAWIDRHSTVAFTLLSTLYFIAIACLSHVKLLWLDELITLHIARLNSATAIWKALASGADPNPPLIHLSVMFCRRLFGEHAFALRLPACLGYWVGMLSLYLFLKRRVSATWALAGTLLSMCMGGFDWSFESRSYAVFYGFAMLALYAWSCATQPRAAERGASPATRRWSLPTLALALAGGLCTNYFSVLAFFPIAFGELTRTIGLAAPRSARSRPEPPRQRIDWPVWIALAVAATPLLIFRHFIKTSIALYAPYAWNKVSIDGVVYGYIDIVEAVLGPLLVLMMFVIAIELLSKFCVNCRTNIRPCWIGKLASARANSGNEHLLSHPEAAAVSVLVAYPFIGFAVAWLRGGMLSPRFVIPVCLGVAITATLMAYRTFGQLRAAASFALGITLLWFAGRSSFVGYQYAVQKESFYRVLASVPAPEYPGQPLALSDNLLVLPVRYYAPPEMAARVVYPVDFPAIVRNRGEAASEVNLWTGREYIYDLPIIPLATLQRSVGTYIVLASSRKWLVDDLRRHFYDVEPLGIDMQVPDIDSTTTPLSHGKPVLFRATGDLYPHFLSEPIPFDPSTNIPKQAPMPGNTGYPR